MEKTWLTVDEVCEYLDISPATVYRWAREGTLPRHKVGKVTRFKKEDIDKLLEQGLNGKK